MEINAINSVYQRDLERLYKADRRYSDKVDLNMLKLDKLDPDSDKYHDFAERAAQSEAELYDIYRDNYVWKLPKRELDKFVMTYTAFHGYEPYLV